MQPGSRMPAIPRTRWLVMASFVALASACASVDSGPLPPQPRTFPSGVEKPKPEVVSSRELTNRGGPVDWCAAKNVIAYAHESKRMISEIYTIDPSGENERCITCKNKILTQDLQRKIRGDRGRRYRTAPAWHPSCNFMAIEIGTRHFKPSLHERSPFGINHSVWLIAADGSWAEEIISVGKNEAAFRPHFSETGDRLFWSAREPTGMKQRQGKLNQTPGGESPWDGWYLSIADFERTEDGPAVLSNRVDLYRDEEGWFSATALTGDTIWFSHTPNGRGFIDELFRAKVDGNGRKKVLGAEDTWEDQGMPSPWGSLFTYRSSQPYAWKHPRAPLGTLRLELWALTREEERVELTAYNKPVSRVKRVLPYDYAWGPRGRQVAVYTLTYEIGTQPRHTIEILRLNDAF